MLRIGFKNKYRLRGHLRTKEVKKICIRCGKELNTSMVDMQAIDGIKLPLPNTTEKIKKGVLNFGDGRLACWLGDHDYYFSYELEKCS